MLARLDGGKITLPGLATAHSHAFQRALRGKTQRRDSSGNSFWSWRGLMYELAGRIDPDTIYALSRHAYAELALAGVTAVGEFHYVHHQADGTPYGDRTTLADAVIRAARDVGIRISLLRVLYHRGGAGRPAEGAQRRFSDTVLDDALKDVEALAARYREDDRVEVGVAPHSIRAVPRGWLRDAAVFAREHGMPFHMHVSEQRRELEECQAEHGMTPVDVLATDGILDERFVAVHATHLSPQEITALGDARSFVCVCRTTERDLGDGLCEAAALKAAGARLCTGVDSHAISDPFEEVRAIELDDRSRTESRHACAEAEELLRAATEEGYAAIGMDGRAAADRVVLDADDPALVGVDEVSAADMVVFAATPRAVADVSVGGRQVVQAGELPDRAEITDNYRAALEALLR